MPQINHPVSALKAQINQHLPFSFSSVSHIAIPPGSPVQVACVPEEPLGPEEPHPLPRGGKVAVGGGSALLCCPSAPGAAACPIVITPRQSRHELWLEKHNELMSPAAAALSAACLPRAKLC